MTFDEYQTAARRTTNPALNDRDRVLDAAAGLSEEAGELLGLLRKRAFQAREVPEAALREELGDALWCLAITADALGLRLEEVATANITKLERRHRDGLTQGRQPEDSSRPSAR